jgi:hypothetical protein
VRYPSQRFLAENLPGIVFAILPVFFLQAVWRAYGNPFAWRAVAIHIAFVAGVLLAALAGGLIHGRLKNLWGRLLPGAGLLLLGTAYALTESTLLAWAALGSGFALLLLFDRAVSANRGLLSKTAVVGVLALAAGGLAGVAMQLEARFSDEEFYVALQILELACLWLLLRLAWIKLTGRNAGLTGGQTPVRWLLLPLLALAIAVSVVTLRAYQHSFYPSEAPVYEGIQPDKPFLCGTTSADPQVYSAGEIYRWMVEQVEANTRRGVIEAGFLALATAEARWVEEFRAGLLAEARQGAFTLHANILK